jgi:2-polyprenyl-6-methoxyphenol hydroxylase-like FAD-dependent oxidoreductase
MTAVLLTEAGVDTRVIDREGQTTSRSYACALHPASIALLKRLGIAEAVLAQGRRLPTVGFYDGPDRKAEIRLAEAMGAAAEFPFLLVVPQSVLERALEQWLTAKGVPVQWNHRFDAVEEENDFSIATVEVLGGTSTGYIVPHWETVVQQRKQIRSEFLVGADGHHSIVRHRAGIDYERLAGPQFFAAYEFISDADPGTEVRVVLDEQSTNVLWPLPGNRCRWTFQVRHSELTDEFPEKERSEFRVAQKAADDVMREYVERAAKRRAPWFTAAVKEIAWCTEVLFEQRLARSFGQGLCWLAGDAAHQTGPVGMQSMNLGFAEADLLAATLRKVLREDAPASGLQEYHRHFTKEWRTLLGLTGGLRPAAAATPWTAQRAPRLLPCLPASTKEIPALAAQLGLVLS